jgi:hypothetical protein
LFAPALQRVVPFAHTLQAPLEQLPASLPTMHAVPLAAFAKPQALPLHVAVMQLLPLAGQLATLRHWTQLGLCGLQ